MASVVSSLGSAETYKQKRMSSAASRLVSFRNNASIQNLIQRHLLRPSASTASSVSVTQLLNTEPEPQLLSQFNTEHPKPNLNVLPIEKPWCNAAEIMKYSSDAADKHFPLSTFGHSGVDESGIAKIHARRICDFSDDNEDPDRDFDDSDHEDYGDYDEEEEEEEDAFISDDDLYDEDRRSQSSRF